MRRRKESGSGRRKGTYADLGLKIVRTAVEVLTHAFFLYFLTFSKGERGWNKKYGSFFRTSRSGCNLEPS